MTGNGIAVEVGEGLGDCNDRFVEDVCMEANVGNTGKPEG